VCPRHFPGNSALTAACPSRAVIRPKGRSTAHQGGDFHGIRIYRPDVVFTGGVASYRPVPVIVTSPLSGKTEAGSAGTQPAEGLCSLSFFFAAASPFLQPCHGCGVPGSVPRSNNTAPQERASCRRSARTPLKSLAINCGPLREIIRGRAPGSAFWTLQRSLNIGFPHRAASTRFDEVAPSSVEHGLQTVRGGVDVDMRDIDMPRSCG
jgi:hypothetical protein